MDVTALSIRLEAETDRKIINDSFRIIKKIGQGQFGKVLQGEVINKKTCDDNYVAIKTINRIDKTRLITKAYLSQTTKIKREIQIMKECNHPNVVKLYQVIDDLKYDKILLILEYCKFGEIDWKRYSHYYEKYQNHMNNRNPLTINKILRDVINGLEYLHDYKKIIHRDLKPSNLLINSDNTIKISDFGVSLILENNANDEKELGKTMGTPAFFAPELCQFVGNRYSMITNVNHHANKIKIDGRIDIWSLGITLYCLMFNDLPFSGSNEYELFQNIVKDELRFPKIIKNSRTTEDDIQELAHLKDLIKKLLIKDPDSRITIEKIKLHPFTTFDLNDLERKKFFKFNEAIFKDASKKQQLASNESNGTDSVLSKKLKLFFGSKTPEKKTLAPAFPIVKDVPIEQFKDLEPVDDLLDSYLDDSTTSYGSDIDDEDQPVDTNNILKSLNDSESFVKRLDKIDISKVEEKTTNPEPIPISKPKLKPKPLDLSKSRSNSSIISSQTSNSKVRKWSFKTNNESPKRGDYQSDVSPITPTNNNFMTIGAGSPSSIKSIFSPSKRFFSRNKREDIKEESKPTISSLSSPHEKRSSDSSNKQRYIDLMEPPPIFGLNSSAFNNNNNNNNNNSNSTSSARNSALSAISKTSIGDISQNINSSSTGVNNNLASSFEPNLGGTNSRKNSMNSSQFGYGLSRITSSSSSLNLNAYLTDDSYTEVSMKNHYNSQKKTQMSHTKSFKASDNNSSGEENTNNDDTFVLETPQQSNHFEGLNDYLDRLN